MFCAAITDFATKQEWIIVAAGKNKNGESTSRVLKYNIDDDAGGWNALPNLPYSITQPRRSSTMLKFSEREIAIYGRRSSDPADEYPLNTALFFDTQTHTFTLQPIDGSLEVIRVRKTHVYSFTILFSSVVFTVFFF
jgi:hypothetical protein